MTTIETLIQDLQQLLPHHLEEVGQLVETLKAKQKANRELAERTMEFAGMLSEWTDEEWADFQAELVRTRAELFTRPNPFMDDEPDAAELTSE